MERESIGETIGLLKGEIDKSEQVDLEADAEKKRITLSLEDLKKANKVVDAALWGMERQALALMARFSDPLKDRTSNVRSRWRRKIFAADPPLMNAERGGHAQRGGLIQLCHHAGDRGAEGC